MNGMMKNKSRSSGWMIGADTACRADARVTNTTKNYLTWTQEQVGTGTGTWPFMGEISYGSQWYKQWFNSRIKRRVCSHRRT